MIPPDAFYTDLWDRLHSGAVRGKEDLQRAKADLVRRHGLSRIPGDSEILARAPPEVRESFGDVLRVKPTRTRSGVAVVAVMTPPHACPHGTCVYCPGGPRFGTPQSYTGREPALLRASAHGYDPAAQTAARIDQLRRMGHPTDKVDLIVLGGTFTALDGEFREGFVKACFDGLNGAPSANLEEAHRRNEAAESRCVGLTVETKPDRFLGPEVEDTLRLGGTRVELGVQTTHDDVLAFVNRGHTDADTRAATARARGAGLKIGYHMMPGLPGNDRDRDLESFRAIFEDPAYRPDLLKIYPTLVLEGTALHGLWKAGRYRPMSTEEAVDLVADVKRIVPRWVRIQRVQREIGADAIDAGPEKGDLRVRARRRLRDRGGRCVCIRCREVGLRDSCGPVTDVVLHRREYEASGGTEVFLSFEDPAGDVLVGYARLRCGPTGAFLREVKVFGEVVPLDEAPGRRWQHRGFGARLTTEAERIAGEEFRARVLRVTSGVGVRGYYRRLGYARDGPYMARPLP